MEIESAAPCLAVDAVVSGWRPKSKRNTYYGKKLPRASSSSSSSPRCFSLWRPEAASGPVHLRLQIPALSELPHLPPPPRPILNRRLLWRKLVKKNLGFFAPHPFLSPGAISLCTGAFGWCGWLVIFPQLLLWFLRGTARAPSFLLTVDSGGHSVEHFPCGAGWRCGEGAGLHAPLRELAAVPGFPGAFLDAAVVAGAGF